MMVTNVRILTPKTASPPRSWVESAEMWQPNRAQWVTIWVVAVLLIVAWPPGDGKSLGAKVLNWAVDPGDALPALPPALPMSLDDDGDAVAAHDALETAYYDAYARSDVTWLRMKLKVAGDPLDQSTERQILSGAGIIAALAIWRMGGKTSRIG